jgi:hypothetical protein
MLLTPDTLKENGYVLIDELDHKELLPFIQKYMKEKTFYPAFYYFCNVFFLGMVGFLFTYGHDDAEYSFANRFAHFSYGMAISFLLIPLHEYIHVLAYKSLGAEHTSYDVNWKKFYFMALAHKFVANRKQFTIVALSPFTIITTAFLIIFIFANTDWAMTCAATLLAHTAMCGGDFGLLSYFEYHKHKTIVTYDDIHEKKSYFYERKEQGGKEPQRGTAGTKGF